MNEFEKTSLPTRFQLGCVDENTQFRLGRETKAD